MNTINLPFNSKLFEQYLKENNLTLMEFSRISGVSNQALYHAKNRSGISERFVKMLADYTDISVEEWTRDVPIDKYVEQYKDECEEVIMGLIGNIENRLSATLTNPTINEIMETVKNLIIESTYLGVMAQKNGNSGFVENAMKRRLAR